MKPPYLNPLFDTLVTIGPNDLLKDMADRILCYPRRLVAAVTDTSVPDDHLYQTLVQEHTRIVPRDVTRC